MFREHLTEYVQLVAVLECLTAIRRQVGGWRVVPLLLGGAVAPGMAG